MARNTIEFGMINNGLRVTQFDLLNASFAIANKVALITRDKNHFPRINNLSEFDFETYL